MVSIKVDIKKKDFVWIGLVIVLISVGFVVATWDTSKTTFHSSDDVKITIDSIDYSLQEALDGGLIGGGGTTQATQATGVTDVSTNSLSWVDMPDMSITMTTTGGKVLVMFSAPIIGQSSALDGYVRLLIDGQEKRQLSFFNYNYEGHHVYKFYDMQWLETGLSAGTHTFKVQWKEGGVHAPSNALLQNGATYRRVLDVIEFGSG